VQQGLGNPKTQRGKKQVDRFNVSIHSACWRKYNVRPAGGNPNPEQTDYRYCIYDKMHNDYGYTQAWVDFLIEKLQTKKSSTAYTKLRHLLWEVQFRDSDETQCRRHSLPDGFALGSECERAVPVASRSAV
jgi:hypothetical protein